MPKTKASFGGPNGGGTWRKDLRTEWPKAETIVMTMAPEFRGVVNIAVRQEAQFLRKKIVQNITSGGNKAGAPFAPLSPNTIVSRRFRNRPVGKVLIDQADLRNSITVHVNGDEAFVGVHRTARGKDGRYLSSVAKVHEFGQTIAIPVTRAMLRFLMVMFKQADSPQQTSKPGRLRVGGQLIVKVPARPFIRPVVEKHYLGPNAVEARRRFLSRVGKLMRGKLGHVPGGGAR